MIKKLVFIVLLSLQVKAQDQIVELCSDQKSEFTYTATGTPYSNWDWTLIKDGVTLKNTKNTDNYLYHKFTSAGKYEINVQLMNNKCYSDIQTYYIEVIDCRVATIYFPTAFTPNKDGKNEIYLPVGTYLQEYELKIFNKWGELIFVSQNIEYGWDGTHSGTDCISSAYKFVCHYKDIHGQKGYNDGMINLYR